MISLHELHDHELIACYVAGNSKGFEVLLERHKNRLFSYIFYTVKDKHKAEDIFQETCIKAITTLLNGRYADSGRFLPWLIRIAHNLMIDHFRTEKQLNLCTTDNLNIPILNSTRFSERTIEDSIVEDQIHADVRNLINYLPAEQKEVILLRHYGDLSFKEIAEYTNVSINTALGRMRYALINLRRIIKEKGIQLTDAAK
jgi:RNA polymerase sigma-70 factor (ECF subfamily)